MGESMTEMDEEGQKHAPPGDKEIEVAVSKMNMVKEG